MEKAINTCVLGVGLAGLTFHVPFILALPEVFTLHSVLERNPQSSGGKVHDRFGVTAKIHRTLEQVLEDIEIELVIVGTPNQTHYSFAKAALEAGKHVLVDKPVTATVEQAKELGDLARSKGLVLYGFQNRRWDSDFLALKRLLALPKSSPQSLGTLVEFESHFDRYRKGLKGTWKDKPLPAAGQTYDLGSHLIDQALTLFGRPDKLTSFIQNVRGVGSPEVDDTFTIHFHYAAGPTRPHPFTAILRAHILSVRSAQLRYLVRGTQGTYTKFGLDIQEDQLKVIPAPQAILEDAYGKEPETIWGTVENLEGDNVTVKKSIWPSSDAGQYIELFKNLGAAIRNKADLVVKWEEATAVIEMIELAHKSSREVMSHDQIDLLPQRGTLPCLTSMSLVELRVELPAYAHSFIIQIPSTSTIRDVKQAIFNSCIGRPRVDGQRIIWRGRYLVDHENVDELWKSPDEPRIVHLAVHPSAWSSSPPEVPPPSQTPTQAPIFPHRTPFRELLQPDRPGISQIITLPPSPRALAYVLSKHQAALAALSGDATMQINNVESTAARTMAAQAIERHGWAWPTILDEEFPPATDGGLKYERVTHDGQHFLSLTTPLGTPTPLQLHALKVLSYTFSLLSIPPTVTVPNRTAPSQAVPIPPNVNHLLQQLGLPQMRVAQNQIQNPNPNQIMPALREMPLRPLLAPLMMLLFRTLLLLYFVAPARKPIFGILILAWMLYEIWRPIRNGLMRGLRAAAAENQQNQPLLNVAARQPRNEHAQNPPADAPRPPPNPLAGVAAGNIDLQAGAALDALATVNISGEERILNDNPGINTPEPSFSHKIGTLLSLLVTTIHPAVWNRRRAALRQREGRIRTEANIRDAPAGTEGEDGTNDDRPQLRNALQEQYNRRPRWIREYMERVVAAEWVDDSD
ncbi:hypothetical protein D9615_000258 [Tricholomella constricta]|uniref:Ubiquitin-like domain-containing protein n=1 Tax=Tricholomella constricta TaxID=117010 RepID=A0A8H5HR47_9AGAR|nr:hypothetical protein D9615_000258 [Tricholomella constricta]